MQTGRVPGQEVGDAIDRMVGDALEHVVQICLRIQALEFSRLDQVVNDCRPLASSVGPGERRIASVDCDRTHGAFGSRAIDAGAVIAQDKRQRAHYDSE